MHVVPASTAQYSTVQAQYNSTAVTIAWSASWPAASARLLSADPPRAAAVMLRSARAHHTTGDSSKYFWTEHKIFFQRLQYFFQHVSKASVGLCHVSAHTLLTLVWFRLGWAGLGWAGLGWAGLRTSNSSFPPFLCQIPVAAPVWSVSPVLTPWWTPAAARWLRDGDSETLDSGPSLVCCRDKRWRHQWTLLWLWLMPSRALTDLPRELPRLTVPPTSEG